MSGPQNVSPRPLAMGALEEIERELERRAGAQGWEFLEQQFAPAMVAQNFDPGDEFKRNIAAFARTAFGRSIVDWLLDLTCRAPYPVTSQIMHDLVYAAAKHQARAAVGETIVKAIADGNALLDRTED